MIVFFGTRQYGKVDHVPGLFYIATNFFYLQFVPLFPTGTVLVLDDGSQRGVTLGLSGKSVLFTYLRAVTLLGGILAMVLGVIEIAERNPGVGAVVAGLGVISVLLFFISYKLAKPSAARRCVWRVRSAFHPKPWRNTSHTSTPIAFPARKCSRCKKCYPPRMTNVPPAGAIAMKMRTTSIAASATKPRFASFEGTSHEFR